MQRSQLALLLFPALAILACRAPVPPPAPAPSSPRALGTLFFTTIPRVPALLEGQPVVEPYLLITTAQGEIVLAPTPDLPIAVTLRFERRGPTLVVRGTTSEETLLSVNGLSRGVLTGLVEETLGPDLLKLNLQKPGADASLTLLVRFVVDVGADRPAGAPPMTEDERDAPGHALLARAREAIERQQTETAQTMLRDILMTNPTRGLRATTWRTIAETSEGPTARHAWDQYLAIDPDAPDRDAIRARVQRERERLKQFDPSAPHDY